jgi:hypothetical protein
MRTIIHCGQLFTGTSMVAAGQAIVIENKHFVFAGPRAEAPAVRQGDIESDIHTHLSYGNALGQEDMDLYGSMECNVELKIV